MENQNKDYIQSYWVAVDGPEYNCFERIFHNKPHRANSGAKLWFDSTTNGKIQKLSNQWVGDNDYSMILPYGTIEKLIGRKLTWKDEPVEIKIDLDNYGPKNIYKQVQKETKEHSYLFKPDGTVLEIKPSNGKEFSIQECYDLIGCEVIGIYNINNRIILCDENGHLNHKEWNYPVMEFLKGHGFINIPEFVGNCMVIKSGQLKRV